MKPIYTAFVNVQAAEDCGFDIDAQRGSGRGNFEAAAQKSGLSLGTGETGDYALFTSSAGPQNNEVFARLRDDPAFRMIELVGY